MNRSASSRVLSAILALVMVFSMIPFAAFAADDSATYTKITTAEELTTGKYVMLVDTGYAPTVYDNGWLLAEAVTAENGVITDPAANLVWTITVDGTTVKLTDSNGVTVAPKSGNSNGILAGDYDWSVTCADETFQFFGQGSDTTVLASNKGSENKFRSYKTTTVSGNPAGYPSNFTLYKLGEAGAVTPDPTEEPTEAPTEAPTEPEVPEGTAYVLTDTLEAGDVVVLYNAGNTAALTSTASGYKLAGETLTPADNTITTDLETVAWTVGINDDGTYTFTQGEMVLGMVQSGTHINLSVNASDGYTAWTLENSATAGVFYMKNTNMPEGSYGPYYLEWYTGFTAYSSTSPSDTAFGISFYKQTDEVTVDPEVSTIADGAYVIWEATNGKAATALTGNYGYLQVVDVTLVDGTLTGYTEAEIWTITNVADNQFTITDANGKYVYMTGTYNSFNVSAEAPASGHLWTAVANEDGTYAITNVEMGKTISYDTTYGSYGSYANPTEAQLTALTLTPASAVEEPDVPVEPEDPALPFADGDQVVIYAPAYNKALSATKTGNYNVGVDVTVTDGVMTGYGETEIWTVIDNGDGTYSFANGGQNIGMAESYASMNLGTVYDDWTLIDLGGGLYNVQNVGRGNYMEWYVQYSNWSTYNSSSAATDDQFQLAFYVVTGETPEEPEVPEVAYAEKMTELPNDGDTIIIYNSGNAMGSAASGKKLSGVAAEVTEGKLPIAEEMAQLLVTIDEDGNYIFTLDGQYLTSAETGNGLSFAAELTDCGKWTMEAAIDGAWYIKNVGANYNGSYNQALEYYYGFTTYGIQETAVYQMELFLVEAAPSYPVPDGTYVIWAPAYNMALSSNYSGYYNAGVAVTETDGTLSGYTNTEIWTVTNNDDGTICISFGGQNLAMAASYSSMTLGEVNDKWVLEDAGNGLFYVKNTVRGSYIEWYADKNNWSGYNYINSGKEGMFALKFTPAEVSDVTEGTLPAAGEQVVIYNLSAEGVLAAENDTQSIENALTEIVDGKAVPANGGVVFTVEVNGNYYRFYNETYGYLCSNGTGNNAFYSLEASEDADWTLTEGKSGGYNMESRTAKYNGQYSQYLEYYADAYKTYSMYNVTDYDIYEFFFYEVAEGVNVTGGIVNNPGIDFGTLYDAYVGAPYTFSFTVDTVFGVDGELTVMVGETALTANEDGTYTIPAELIAGESLTITVTGTDNKGVAITGTATVTVKDEPVISDVTPAANTETGDNKKPVISAVIVNAGENAEMTMTINDEAVEAVYDAETGILSYTASDDMADGRTTVTVTVTRADGKSAEKTWSFTVGKAQYQLYFGQLHSHTTYSDGSGSLESALDYIASLPESANVDFVAFTDHSNYFDASGAANPEGALYDMTLGTAASQKLWAEYVGAMDAFNAKQSNVIAIPGFEMTWSGGPGHINTFNTPGIVSRNNTTLNNKTADAGMKAYYALLSQPEGIDSISQFNHPGSTFGTFTDFAYWDAVVDTRIQLVEVGNGEGQIGAGGYYPSYEYYTMALDKGWHVAPTNNQDNHKGKWGNANDARDVIITDDFSEEGIYAAIRDMRMYATEDKNLEITYTLNGQMLGSIIEEVPEVLNIAVTVYDPDGSDSISKVEVIVNSGKVAHTWSDPADLADGALSVTLNPDYSYYYIRVTEGDGDLAVTSPVWVGESLKLGISSVVSGTSTPVTDEELTVTTTLFNSESKDAVIKSMTYTLDGKVLETVTNPDTIPASGTVSVDYLYTPTTAKVQKLAVTAVVDLDGKEYTFTMDITLDVQDASKLVYIGIDASHYNEYVNGNYKDSMGNFSNLAAEYSIRTVTLNSSEDLIAACSNEKYKALILTAPSRRSAEAQAADPLKVYTEEELAAINAFNENGGIVILAGWSDHYENYPSVDSIANMKPEEHMAATQNAVLEALGSSLRIGDDATYDDDYNGGQAYRLYFNTYNFDNALVEGVEVDPEHPHDRMYTEVFSHYGGASVYTVDGTLNSTVSPVVFGHSGTYSVDVDKDGLGGDSMYKYEYAEGDSRLMIMATEQLEGRGLIIVSGAAFMSNFEVQATIEDSGSEKNYSNYKICENLCELINPVKATPIAEVRAQEDAGFKYTIEGIVTSNASGYDKDTAFFDCIYVQDETGGICCFPVAGNYKIGDKVRITGTTEFYQGEPELQVSSIAVIGEGYTVESTEITAAELNDRSAEGKLVTISGTVESFELANGLVQTIMVKDAEGNVARVFIDGYITTAEDVQNLEVGYNITATGLASYDDTFNAPDGPFPRIRIRNRADIVCTEPKHDCETAGHLWSEWETTVEATCTEDGSEVRTCGACGETETNVIPAAGHAWSEWETVTDATCTEDGSEIRTCGTCGEKETNIIPAHGHHVVLVESKPASCETYGYEYYACEYCGGEEYQIMIDPIGHNYEDGICTGCGQEDPDASKPGIGSWIGNLIGKWFDKWFGDHDEPTVPPTEPSEPSEPTEPSEPSEPEKPGKPGWGFIWDWIFWWN